MEQRENIVHLLQCYYTVITSNIWFDLHGFLRSWILSSNYVHIIFIFSPLLGKYKYVGLEAVSLGHSWGYNLSSQGDSGCSGTRRSGLGFVPEGLLGWSSTHIHCGSIFAKLYQTQPKSVTLKSVIRKIFPWLKYLKIRGSYVRNTNLWCINGTLKFYLLWR